MKSLTPQRDASGAIEEFSPQGKYAKAAITRLHKHGSGTFCKFRFFDPRGQAGGYALVVAGSVYYIGECEDLVKRFNMGYGNISPKNCYEGGPSTNYKINRWVLEVAQNGGQVDLYFHATSEREAVEKELIKMYLPPWNG